MTHPGFVEVLHNLNVCYLAVLCPGHSQEAEGDYVRQHSTQKASYSKICWFNTNTRLEFNIIRKSPNVKTYLVSKKMCTAHREGFRSGLLLYRACCCCIITSAGLNLHSSPSQQVSLLLDVYILAPLRLICGQITPKKCVFSLFSLKPPQCNEKCLDKRYSVKCKKKHSAIYISIKYTHISRHYGRAFKSIKLKWNVFAWINSTLSLCDFTISWTFPQCVYYSRCPSKQYLCY